MSHELPVLYSFRRCPYAIRARMALLQAGVTVALREVVLRNKPAELVAVSPKATVPVLLCTDGTVIEESLAIMQWALRQNDPAGWLPASETSANRQLVALNDGAFKQALDRYKYPERHPDREQASHRAEAEGALLAPLEERLEQQPFLGGTAPCLSDVAIFPFVRQFAAVDAAWFDASRWRATRSWLRGWLECPAFTRTMVKLPPWQADQTPVRWGGEAANDSLA